MLINWRILFFLVVFAFLSIEVYAQNLQPPCDSRIFCQGPLLHTVQMANLGGPFQDSKYFVDMPLVNTPIVTLRNYNDLIQKTNNNPSKDQIRKFVRDNFQKPGTEFVRWDPDDWKPNPEFLKNIEDPSLEQWAKDLNELWKVLGRKIDPSHRRSAEKSTLLYLSHPFIVPGGRFRETYYWDSYWTMEGLLLSEMDKTVKGMLENFFAMVSEYGFVPNGGRLYYTRRSQPPYLIPMVKLYYEYSGDKDFIRKNIHLLEREFMFWETNRMTNIRGSDGKSHRVARYKVDVTEPRPEGYKEDYKLAQRLRTDKEKENLYVELKSAAESGWDFSTRWFIRDGSSKDIGDLSYLNVTSIVPVDLNSLLCANAKTLSEFYDIIGDNSKSQQYKSNALEKNKTMADLFWDKTDGIWYDFNIHTKAKTRSFYLSNIHPLWSGCYGLEGQRKNTVKKVMDYLEKKKAIDYIGGVPTSLKTNSSEQWDFPNAWAPLQHHIIMGLYNSRNIHPEAEYLSFELAKKWIQTNYAGYIYKNKSMMFEKYDVNIVGVAGRGGEYEVMTGFGWTNGVALKLLDTFGDKLTSTIGGSSGLYNISSLLLMLPFILVILVLQPKYYF